MSEFWNLMGQASLAAILLAPVFTVFGVHIVRRGVIFIDLAVAQAAALGTAFAIASLPAGADFEATASSVYWISLAFALAAALLIALTRFRLGRVPHEAIIGIIFVVASAGSIIKLTSAAHGPEELQNILTGSILLVSPRELQMAAYICAGVLAGVLIIWRWVTAISLESEQAPSSFLTVVFDFAFYALLAVVVASAVKIAGVLVVFTWLVMPAVVAFFWTARIGIALAIAIPIAVIGSLGGIWLSYRNEEWPPGAAIVIVFGAIVAAAYLARLFVRSGDQAAP